MELPNPAAPMQAEEGSGLLRDLTKQMEQKANDAEKYGGQWGLVRWATMIF
jgi:hypothetical protein